jgi:AraC-like DNA-binding protein
MARQRGQAQARLALMKQDIGASLGRGDLSIGVIARRCGLSPREAQRLFEQDGSTFTEYLLEQRLMLACKLLLNPENLPRKISDIAHSAGFTDLSYFNRVFRRRFGITPSEMRYRR